MDLSRTLDTGSGLSWNYEVFCLRAGQLRLPALLPLLLFAVPDRQLESALLTAVLALRAEKLIFFFTNPNNCNFGNLTPVEQQ